MEFPKTNYPDHAPADGNAAEREVVRVLVVDDDPAFRRICREFLRQQPDTDFEVLEAESGQEAMRRCAAENFDCILVDYRLPDICGTSLIATLKKHDSVASPMIMLTGVGSEDIAMEAVHEGAADYLPKQRVTPQSLNRAISHAVERTRLHRWIVDRNRRLETANDQLHRKNDEIQRFYHTVSHEIKTPLTAAREFISLVTDGVMGEVRAEQREALEHALECCNVITRHFNDLVDCTRLETNKLRLERKPVAAGDIVESSVRLVQAEIDSKSMELVRTIGTDLSPIDVDASRICQVLANILSNAVKYSAAGSRIEIGARRHTSQANFLTIEVTDTGYGISPDHLDRIFDRLYQVPAEEDPFARTGLGLGLSISRDIVTLHGGEISVQSAPGVGSTFSVSLPVASAGTAGSAADVAAAGTR